MNQDNLTKLEFNKILSQVSECAYSEGGKEQSLLLKPSSDLDTVQRLLKETEEAMELLRYGEPSFLSFVKIPNRHLQKARVAGLLTSFELLDIYHLLRASRLMVKYVGERSANVLKPYVSEIEENSELEKRIQSVVDEDGGIQNDASLELKHIRSQIETTRLRIKDYLQNFIRSGNNQNLLQDALVTERAGRYVVPVKQEYRNDVKGIVHDESASGATVFIEPLPVVEHNNKIRTLQIEEKREVERILRELSMEVSVFAEELQQNMEILLRMDLIFARSHMAFNMNAFKPDINAKGIIDLQRAKHPLLGDKAVPINVSLGKNFDVLVITGPNTGGKTVVLKTIGLLSLMAMSGLFIPAREKSKIAVFSNIFVDIGDEQSIEQSLSTFSSHMNNIIHILHEVNERSLVLMDELGAGTDPAEGAALARAILEKMKARNARVVVTTHQSELKTFAYQNQRVENACVEFDPRTLSPTYELTIGTPGQSNAFEIATRLGLDTHTVKRARELVPEREMEIGNMIRQLKESRYTFEQSNKELEEEKVEIKSERERLEIEKIAFYSEKEQVLKKAQREADQYVRQVKKEANEAIEEFKELIKQKEKPPKWHEIEQKRKKLKDIDRHALLEEETFPVQHLKPGDYVRIKDISQKGYVLKGPNTQGELVVQVGIMKLTVKQEQCVLAESTEDKKTRTRNQTYLQKAREISAELDLRGQWSDDAIIELDKYLEDANLVGLTSVRIIHGKGTGALRAAVRNYLNKHRYVKEFRDGQREEGGYGVTVITLK
ncbi:MAG: endonuclease MutS2 [Bacillota bacterium]|nr:endonuclease MutS2 [Bacillota bacterium]